MQRSLSVTVLLIAALLAATPSSADPISAFNDRPTTINTIAAEPAAQALLDQILGPGLNSYSDQSPAALWSLMAAPYVLSSSLEFEYAGYRNFNLFGVWSGTDSSAVSRVPVFLGAATGTGSGVPTHASLSWSDDGSRLTIAGDCSKVNCGTFGNIDPLRFGFYLQAGPAATLYYTADALNGDGMAHAFAYTAANSNTWAIAFEDWNDFDYNDGVIRASGLTPSGGPNGGAPTNPASVPEPLTLALMGIGMGVAALRRRA